MSKHPKNMLRIYTCVEVDFPDSLLAIKQYWRQWTEPSVEADSDGFSQKVVPNPYPMMLCAEPGNLLKGRRSRAWT